MEISNTKLLKAAELFDTPYYFYDRQLIEQQYVALRDQLNDVNIFYSLKANPNLMIATLFNQLGAGVEVCSGVELKTALLAGFLPENILFVGPMKKTADIVTALNQRICAIVCESKEELTLINALAQARNEVAQVVIRINPTFLVKDASLRMGGVSSQFGIDQEELFTNKKFFLEKKHVTIRGIHVFNGTRILNAAAFLENTQKIMELARELEEAWRVSFELIDIGGGIGVPYFKNEKTFAITELKKLTSLIRSRSHARIILESGRYLMANAGVFVARIESIKVSRGMQFLITDGGMNCHLTAAGYGSILKRNFPMQLLSERKPARTCFYHVTGPLCTPADTIGQSVELPEAKVGDYIAILASGAYGPTASPVLFLGHGYPAEILCDDGKFHLIRERDNADDFLRKQRIFSLHKTVAQAVMA